MICSLSSSPVFAQLVLNCDSSYVDLDLIGKQTLSSPAPVQCSVSNNQPDQDVSISLSNLIFKINGIEEAPTGTIEVKYSINGSNLKTIGGPPETLPQGTGILMKIYMQENRQEEFFAGTYDYQLTIDITAP